MSEEDKAIETHLKKVLEGPPLMRELSPAESLAIADKAAIGDGRIDYNKQIRLTLQAMLGKNPEEVAATVSAYSDLVERMTFIQASKSRRLSFLRAEGLIRTTSQSSSI